MNRHPPTADRARGARRGTEAGGARGRARGHLQRLMVLALVAGLAGCSGASETPNRDRLPRRTPAPVVTPPPDTTDAGPDRSGLFDSFADYEQQRQAAAVNLREAIGTPTAASVTDCKSVPVGAKACGGPRSYAIYSASGDDEIGIIRLAARITALDREANEQFGLNSDCALTPEPSVAVENGVCVAR
ncbi:MAG: hypothetical protein AAF791_15730 [Bacteroidota bacterium]